MIVRWLYETAVNIIKATCLSLSAERSIIYCNLHVSHVLIKREYKVLFFSLSSWTLFDRQSIFNGLFSAHVHSIYMKITAIRYWIHNIYIAYLYGLHYIYESSINTHISQKHKFRCYVFRTEHRSIIFKLIERTHTRFLTGNFLFSYLVFVFSYGD